MDEVVESEGACGHSQRVHLSPAALGTVIAASPGARVLVLQSYIPPSYTVFHPASGRTTHTSGRPVGFSPDERRVLLWDGDYETPFAELREVDAVTGHIRALVGAKVAAPAVLRGGTLVWLRAEDGRAFVHSLQDGSTQQLSGASTWPYWSGSQAGYPQRVLAGDGSGFFVWDATTGQRWTVPSAEGARLLADGSGAVYVDAQGIAWGWTPELPPARLGLFGPVYDHRIWLWSDQPTPEGELLFVGRDGQRVLWNVRTGVMGPVPETFFAAREPSGTRLLFRRTLPEGGLALVLREPADGSERIVLRTEGRAYGVWSPRGEHIAVLEHPSADLDSSHFVVRLFRSTDGQELLLQPALSGSSYNEGPGLFFADEGRVLHVSSEMSDAFYATADGVRRYVTSRASVPAEGHNYYWGPDGVFYGQQGAYMGPPDQGLFTWNPRTGVETELGRGTQAVCFLGPHHLFQHDLPPRMYEPGPLASWVSATGERQELSAHANRPICAARAGGVVFQEEFREQSDGAWKGALVFASPTRGCRQTLAEDVQQFWASEDHVLLFTASGVWRASYPKP